MGLIYPKFYHCNRWGSDRDWIFKKLSIIPESLHVKISRRYEALYLNNRDRRKANLYIHFMAYIERVRNETEIARKSEEIRAGKVLRMQEIKAKV